MSNYLYDGTDVGKIVVDNEGLISTQLRNYLYRGISCNKKFDGTFTSLEKVVLGEIKVKGIGLKSRELLLELMYK